MENSTACSSPTLKDAIKTLGVAGDMKCDDCGQENLGHDISITNLQTDNSTDVKTKNTGKGFNAESIVAKAPDDIPIESSSNDNIIADHCTEPVGLKISLPPLDHSFTSLKKHSANVESANVENTVTVKEVLQFPDGCAKTIVVGETIPHEPRKRGRHKNVKSLSSAKKRSTRSRTIACCGQETKVPSSTHQDPMTNNEEESSKTNEKLYSCDKASADEFPVHML